MSPSPEPSRADCVTANVKRRVDRCDMLNKSLGAALYRAAAPAVKRVAEEDWRR